MSPIASRSPDCTISCSCVRARYRRRIVAGREIRLQPGVAIAGKRGLLQQRSRAGVVLNADIAHLMAQAFTCAGAAAHCLQSRAALCHVLRRRHPFQQLGFEARIVLRKGRPRRVAAVDFMQIAQHQIAAGVRADRVCGAGAAGQQPQRDDGSQHKQAG